MRTGMWCGVKARMAGSPFVPDALLNGNCGNDERTREAPFKVSYPCSCDDNGRTQTQGRDA